MKMNILVFVTPPPIYHIQMNAYVVQVFFCVIKTNIVNIIKFDLIKIRLNNFRCFLLSTHFLIFMQQDFIHRTVKNTIIILLPAKIISWCGIGTVVLSRYTYNIIKTKVSHDLAFIL